MGGNKKISPKTTKIKGVKNAFFVENVQKSFYNWERISLLMAGTLGLPPF